MAVIRNNGVNNHDDILTQGCDRNDLDETIIVLVIPTKNRRFRAFQTDMERVDMTDLARRKGSDCDSLHMSVFYS